MTANRRMDPSPLAAKFVVWLSMTKKISRAEAWMRYRRSVAAIPGGHSGTEYRQFCGMAHRLLEVFFADTEPELQAAYQAHAPLHFLRMLSYSDPTPEEVERLAEEAVFAPAVSIVDYGCGLAQLSKALAQRLALAGLNVKLTLCDLPTIREAFLRWDAHGCPYATRFVRCSATVPSPKVPSAHVVIATEFFEHVYRPLIYLRHLHRALVPGGILVTNLLPHQREFMHVTPVLAELHRYLVQHGYEEIDHRRIYRKPWMRQA